MSKKLSYKQVKELIEQQKCVLLSIEYVSAKSKIEIRCSAGHQYEVTLCNFKQGRRCPYCANVKTSYQQVKVYMEQQGYTLLSETYKNAHFKLMVQCNREHQYQVTWAGFQQGNRCPTCSNNDKKISYQQIRRYIEQRGYHLLLKECEYENRKANINIECNKGHRYQTTWNSFRLSKYGCPHCTGNIVTYEQVKRQIENIFGYKLLSREYQNSQSKLHIECNKGHQYYTGWNVIRQGAKCPICNESKGEAKIAQILDSLSITYTREYKLEKGRSLKLDFYLPKFNIGIEYDGEHHFMPIQYRGTDLEKAQINFKLQQERDVRKNHLCKENGYTLVRIAYNEELSLENIKVKLQTSDKYKVI